MRKGSREDIIVYSKRRTMMEQCIIFKDNSDETSCDQLNTVRFLSNTVKCLNSILPCAVELWLLGSNVTIMKRIQ